MTVHRYGSKIAGVVAGRVGYYPNQEWIAEVLTSDGRQLCATYEKRSQDAIDGAIRKCGLRRGDFEEVLRDSTNIHLVKKTSR